MALALALTIVRTKGDVLRLVTVVPTSYAEVTGQQLLAKFQEIASTGCCTTCCDVVVGGGPDKIVSAPRGRLLYYTFYILDVQVF
jgi:hypothetical protein